MPFMDFVKNFFDPGRAYEKAGEQAERGWDEAKGYQMPFFEAGKEQIPGLQEAIGKLLNPAALESEWASGYEASPYAKEQMERSKELGLDAASSMGLMGSSPALENIQRGASSIMRADRQQYLNDLLQKYFGGVAGAQNLVNTGATAGTNLEAGALRTGENLATTTYGENAARGNMLGKILGAIKSGLFSDQQPGGGGAGGGGGYFGQGISKYLPGVISGGGM